MLQTTILLFENFDTNVVSLKLGQKILFFFSVTLKYLWVVLKAISMQPFPYKGHIIYYPDFEAGGCGFDPDGGHVCINI